MSSVANNLIRNPKRIAIVVGEASGDILGAGLVAQLKKQFPQCRFEGIGGPRMLEQGFISHFPMDRLAVMGLWEPLKRLPELLRIRRWLKQAYLSNPPDIFIGIDAPDFNLSLEEALRNQGVLTAHYVSPSVWAWRQGRVKKIARAVDLMLTLFPFEAEFYRAHEVKVICVGHTLADQIPLQPNHLLAREQLGVVSAKEPCIALLPGSRASEVRYLTPIFLDAARLCLQVMPTLKFVIPAANAMREKEINAQLISYPDLPVTLVYGNSHRVMAAADAVLMASGTTTLEALLLKRPMVIAYRMAGFSYSILKRLVKSKFIGLPNLLAGEMLVPEFIQGNATAANLATALLRYFNEPVLAEDLQSRYLAIHNSLRLDADRAAAQALTDLLADRQARAES